VALTGRAKRVLEGGPAGPDALPERKARPPEPDLLAMATSFASLFLEVEAGQRPREQLACVMDPRLWTRLAPTWVRPCTRGRVRTIHGVRDQGVYDAVVIVQRGSRVTALSLRLGRTPAGWRVEEIARPEEGPLPDLALDWTEDGEGEDPRFTLADDDQ
jgi:hypothetical protein